MPEPDEEEPASESDELDELVVACLDDEDGDEDDDEDDDEEGAFCFDGEAGVTTAFALEEDDPEEPELLGLQ